LDREAFAAVPESIDIRLNNVSLKIAAQTLQLHTKNLLGDIAGGH